MGKRGKPPIPVDHIRTIYETACKHPRGKSEKWKYYKSRICDEAKIGKVYSERTIQAIIHVKGDPVEYRIYTDKRNHREKAQKVEQISMIASDDFPGKPSVGESIMLLKECVEVFCEMIKEDLDDILRQVEQFERLERQRG
jgi:hypothetical protein